MATGTIPRGLKLLWKNADATQSFNAQKIDLADNNCSLFIVLCVHQSNDQTIFPAAVVVPTMPSVLMDPQGKTNGYTGEISLIVRKITASTQTSLTFALADVLDKNGNAYTGRGDLAVPYAVYGI